MHFKSGLTRGREAAALLLILALFGLLGWTSAAQKSVTFDEAMLLPAGLSYLRTGDFRLEPFNAPLIRMATALPIWHSGVKLPLASGWSQRRLATFGYEFMYANAADYQRIFLRCRVMTMLMAAAAIVLCWGWARKLYGPAAGLAAALLLAFDPTVMAHSQLVTTDLGSALTFLAAVLAFWALCRRFTWTRTIIAGAALGAALLAKFSSVVLIPLLPALILGWRRGGEKLPAWRQVLLKIAAVYILGWAVVCSLYGWRGFGAPLKAFTFQSGLFRRAQAMLPAALPVPLPYQCLQGLDLTNTKNRERSCYFNGSFSGRYMPYYFLVALAAKTPLPTLALMVLGTLSLGRAAPRWWREEWFIVLPLGTVVVFISLFATQYLGVRYLLPAYPFLALSASRIFSPGVPMRRRTRLMLAALLAGPLVSNLAVYPDYLAYFNLAAGGPSRGYRLLADSNLDWGQDLIGLKDYLEAEKLDHICLAYFGKADPAVYGIDHEFPEQPEQCEVLAVSVQFVLGFSCTVISNGQPVKLAPDQFSSLKTQTPTAVIGHSIWVFDHRPKPQPP